MDKSARQCCSHGPLAHARGRIGSETGLSNARQSGVALIIVLGFLVLITVLIVAFFSSVTTETSVSKTYSNGATTKFLSDAAVNVVMGQIAAGTQGQLNGERMTWASQPGMIRTYDDQGNADSCYKLYSSSQMVIASGTGVLSSMANDLPNKWNTLPAFYTDLNAPVADSTGALNYPIMSGDMTSLSVGGSNVLTYYTPTSRLSPKVPDIEGAWVSQSPVSNYTGTNPSPTNNPVPMPVQWLYTLQDGTIISPDPPTPSQSGSTATFNTAMQSLSTAEQQLFKSGSNPIVGRMAFWTDDETCKLNINTASEGTYYAFPHTNTATDISGTNKTFGFAISPPASDEYNRYPGHPATTCLSVALGRWLTVPSLYNSFGYYYAPSAYSSAVNDQTYLGLSSGTPPPISGPFSGLSAYMLLSPRTSGTCVGGSLAGTVDESGSATAVTTKADRLYDSPDEVMFRYPVSGDAGPRTPFPSVNFPTSGLNKGTLENLKFFLTANSRSPELTPFNTPKVSMWPQWNQLDARNAPAGPEAGVGLKAAESLLAFCSSFGATLSNGTNSPSGKFEYFFQRYIVPSYMSSNLLNIGWRSSYLDWNSVPRNPQLASYLYQLGTKNIPGYGASLESKYTTTSYSSLIVESMDMIRSLSDMANYVTDDDNMRITEQPPNYQYILPLVMSGTAPNALPTSSSHGPVTLKGVGWYPVCTQVVLQIAYIGTTPALVGSGTDTLVQPTLQFQMFFPAESFPTNGGGINLSETSGTGANLGLTFVTPLPAPFSSGEPTPLSLANLGTSASNNYYISDAPIKVFSASLPLCRVSGTPATIGIGSTTGQPAIFTFEDDFHLPVQNIAVMFPSTQIPMPTAGAGNANYPTNISARGVECGSAGPLRGDWRLLSCLYNPNQAAGQNIFTASNPGGTGNPNDYYKSNYSQVHSLRYYTGGFINNLAGAYRFSPFAIDTGTSTQTSGTIPYITGSGTPNVYVAGSLVGALKNTDYEDYTVPCAPAGLQAATMNNPLRTGGTAPGDWDTGPGLMPDGPFINPLEEWDCAGIYEYYNQIAAASQSTNTTGVEGSVFGVFSPNRIVASPVRFGSLPTGVDPDKPQPWQTLLFCPNPAARTTLASGTPTTADHIGFGNPGPPDSAYLEFFTMPVVQPYAISEPLSTAGKVNLNYQLAPFTYIERSTALRGVLKDTLVSAISPADVQGAMLSGSVPHPTPIDGTVSPKYKFYLSPAQLSGTSVRYPYETHYDINRDATIAGIEEHYFSQGQLFKYPSEICGVFLVPQALPGATYNPNYSAPPTSYDNMMTWWQQMSLTGDNLREEPYDRLYPRLTTKSNTYTVHCRVQVLKQTPSDAQSGVWTEGKDQMVAEYRGSSLIERYIDPNDPSLDSNWDNNTTALNLGATSDNPDLSRLYKFRVVNTKKFAP